MEAPRDNGRRLYAAPDFVDHDGPPRRRFARVSERQGLSRLLPEGLDPPADVPPDIFTAALGTFLAGRRLDMQSLAAEVGIARATLYRRVQSRDQLLGEVIWYLVRRAVVAALRETDGLPASERVVAVAEKFMNYVAGQPAFQRLLEAEPEAALRILTTREGVVQGRLVKLAARLLAEAKVLGELSIDSDPEVLADLIVRIGEGFVYADVVGDSAPDIDRALRLIAHVLGGAAVPGAASAG
jgi:AcrR family transcriptional regulator